MGFKDMANKDLLWIVNYQEINYIGRVPKHCEEVYVSTWPHERKRLDYIREYEISVGNGSILVTPSTPEYLVHGIYGITTAEDCYFRTSDNSQFIGGYWTQDRGEHFYETTGEVVEIETTKD